MPADKGQQLPVAVKDLQQVEHGIGHPDVPIAINRNALGPRKTSEAVAMPAELADELAIGVENLHTVVQRCR